MNLQSVSPVVSFTITNIGKIDWITLSCANQSDLGYLNPLHNRFNLRLNLDIKLYFPVSIAPWKYFYTKVMLFQPMDLISWDNFRVTTIKNLGCYVFLNFLPCGVHHLQERESKINFPVLLPQFIASLDPRSDPIYNQDKGWPCHCHPWHCTVNLVSNTNIYI